MIFSPQCSLPSLLSKCGVYVSETGTSVLGAGEEGTRNQSSEEGTIIDIWSVGGKVRKKYSRLKKRRQSEDRTFS